MTRICTPPFLPRTARTFLPEPFNTPFRRSERKAAKSLEKVLADWEGVRRRRKL